MKPVFVSIVIASFATGVMARTRPSTVNLPCRASRQLVLTRGGVVLGTGGYTYDRFVRDGTFCTIGEYIQQAFVPSLDTPHCFVGCRCKQGPRDLSDD
ncbi:hypothetical protein [Microvirga terrestris]|uniref:KTSC domain-containing protein n=1 Tax=Microvirga terrestris TaxID=2791024 RepID=A0ABS0HTX3_9HYPH|nr:hypothetical protein [Microvirga terrestris]MBF9196935.1 hypothetical protein [Microvirga terrestris]